MQLHQSNQSKSYWLIFLFQFKKSFSYKYSSASPENLLELMQHGTANNGKIDLNFILSISLRMRKEIVHFLLDQIKTKIPQQSHTRIVRESFHVIEDPLQTAIREGN